jgi:hypothetical protein
MNNLLMKSLVILGVIALLLTAACSSAPSLPTGEYVFEDVVYVGGLSSASSDKIRKTRDGTEFIIGKNSLQIIGEDIDLSFTNLTVTKEELTDEFILTNYGDGDEPLLTFLEGYESRFRYSMVDSYGKKLSFYLYEMDGELFISQFAKSDKLIFSIDKIGMK